MKLHPPHGDLPPPPTLPWFGVSGGYLLLRRQLSGATTHTRRPWDTSWPARDLPRDLIFPDLAITTRCSSWDPPETTWPMSLVELCSAAEH